MEGYYKVEPPFLLEKNNNQIYNKEKFKESKQMTKVAETLEAVYIYIYRKI